MWVIYWGKDIDSFEGDLAPILESKETNHDDFFCYCYNPDDEEALKFESMRKAQRYLCKYYHDCAAADIIHIGLARKLYKEWKLLSA